jgi:hypothetical protein
VGISAREQVDGLAELVGWTGSGFAGIDWEAVQRSLGLPVPQDFKELVRRFPPGEFQGSITLSVPEDHGGGIELIGGLEVVLEDMRQWRQDEPERFPYPIYPEKDGLVPWASGSHGETFFWLADSAGPDRWEVVACEFSEMLWERFPVSATQFIRDFVAGSLNSTVFTSANTGRPSFVPFASHGEAVERASEAVRPEYISSMRSPSNEAPSLISIASSYGRNPLAWDDVERRRNLRLPSDYKELIDALGPGSFLDLHVTAPDWPVPDFDLSSQIERTRAARGAIQEDMIPWGWTDDGLTFMWNMDTENPDDWAVFMAQPGFLEYRLLQIQNQRLSMTGVVAHYLAEPLSIAPRLVNPLTRTVVDPRIPPALPSFSPAPEQL